LVLDDYQNVADEALDAQLRLLLEWTGTFRLAIGSRSTTGLHSVELAARVGAALVDARALSFTLDESKALVAGSARGDDPELARVIHASTTGWPLASHALLVEAERDPDNQQLMGELATGHPQFIVEFVRATLAARPRNARDFLLRIALADESTVALAVELTGETPERTRELLDELEREGIGTWQVRSGVSWLRMHPLLRDAFEVHAAKVLDPRTTVRLRGLLAERLHRSRPLRAIELAFASEDWTRMERLLLLHWTVLYYYHRESIMEMLRRIPRAAMSRHPILLANELVDDYVRDSVTLRRLTSAHTGLTTALRGRHILPGVAGALEEIMYAGAFRVSGDLPAALVKVDRAEALLDRSDPEEQRDNPSSLPVLYVQAAITRFMDAQYQRALDDSARSRELALNTGSLGEQFQTVAVTAFIQADRGDIAQALAWVARCEQLGPYDGWRGVYLQAGYHIAKSITAMNQWNAQETLRALSHLDPIEFVLEYWPHVAMTRAHAELTLLGPAEARAALTATIARKQRRPPISSALHARLVALNAQLLLLQGQPAGARTVIRQIDLEGHPDIDLVRSRLASLRGDHAIALSLADAVVQSTIESPRLRAEALLTVATAAHTAGQADRAVDAFTSAFAILDTNGLRTPLMVVPADTLEGLLSLAQESGRAVDERILGGLPLFGRPIRAPGILSDAERRVLQALVSNPNVALVAEDLHLVPSTIRYHLKRSYRKLGVSTRAAAIARAQELGMLAE
jgi:ATP/maltotriose-dependent transcriptional regulator MalT